MGTQTQEPAARDAAQDDVKATGETTGRSLDNMTIGDLKQLIREATAMNKPGRYMQILSSPHAHAAIVALGGIAVAFATKSITLPEAIYSAVGALAAWMHADSNSSKKEA